MALAAPCSLATSNFRRADRAFAQCALLRLPNSHRIVQWIRILLAAAPRCVALAIITFLIAGLVKGAIGLGLPSS